MQKIDIGSGQGLTRAEIAACVPKVFGDAELFSWMDIAPGGEGFVGVAKRAQEFLLELSGPSVVVTHGVCSGFLRGTVLGLDLDEIAGLPGGQAVVNHLKGRNQTRPS